MLKAKRAHWSSSYLHNEFSQLIFPRRTFIELYANRKSEPFTLFEYRSRGEVFPSAGDGEKSDPLLGLLLILKLQAPLTNNFLPQMNRKPLTQAYGFRGKSMKNGSVFSFSTGHGDESRKRKLDHCEKGTKSKGNIRVSGIDKNDKDNLVASMRPCTSPECVFFEILFKIRNFKSPSPFCLVSSRHPREYDEII